MTLFDFLLDDFNENFITKTPRMNLNQFGGDYMKYLRYINEYRKKEDEKIRQFLNTKKNDVEKRKEDLEKRIFKVNEQINEAKTALNNLDLNIQNVIDSVNAGYEHDKIQKMKRTGAYREDKAFACANVMFILADKYNEWEKLTKRIHEYESYLSRLEREHSEYEEALGNIGFYIDDSKPSDVE